MAIYPFGFTVIYTTENNDGQPTYCRESGMGLADSYKTAVQQLENYYGDDMISIKHLELFAEDNLILLPESIMMGYAKTDFGYIGFNCDVDGNLITPTEKFNSIAREVLE